MRNALMGAGAGAMLMTVVLGFIVPKIQQEEGTKYVAYNDLGHVLTVCSGHTGLDVVVDKVYTPAECQQLTQDDAQKAASGVLNFSPHLIYHPMQLASAVSFSYNVGVGTYDKSSVARDFNAGNFIAACNDLLRYVYIGSTYSEGLYNRRLAEKRLCLSTLTSKGVT